MRGMLLVADVLLIRKLSQNVLLMKSVLLVEDVLIIIDVHSSGNEKYAITKRLLKI